MLRSLVVSAVVALVPLVLAQAQAAPAPAHGPAAATTAAPPPAPLLSHEVHPDGSITFRYKDLAATKVVVSTDAAPEALPMQRDEAGIWSVTTPPLPPEQYSYSFVVDGVGERDPLNRDIVPNLLYSSNSLLVPGTTPQPWELRDLPHGEVSHHFLRTQVALNLPAGQEPYVVYTPPGYDAKRKQGYPVLYLLHGYSDSEVGWPEVAHANLILDSLLAEGRIVPMIVVMPLGYGNFEFLRSAGAGWTHRERIDENVALYDRMLNTEIIPAVEREYNVKRDRQDRAIAGLSMGGLESLSIGLDHPDRFAWVVGMSSAVQEVDFNQRFASVTPQAAKLRLLWIACGTSDRLLAPNRTFIAAAKARGFDVTPVETEGRHTWLVWRDNLIHFAPLLFRDTAAR